MTSEEAGSDDGFEWDEAKRRANLEKHGIDEIAVVFTIRDRRRRLISARRARTHEREEIRARLGQAD